MATNAAADDDCGEPPLALSISQIPVRIAELLSDETAGQLLPKLMIDRMAGNDEDRQPVFQQPWLRGDLQRLREASTSLSQQQKPL